MVEPQNIHDIAIDFVKQRKKVSDVTVIVTEQKDGVWIIRGTCTIDLAGHPWRESFEVVIDQKGKIRTSSFKLM